MTLLVDYSWTHPNPASIKADGYSGVLRYLSFDSTKNLTPAERDALHAAGLGIGLVWESTGGRATQGLAAGVSDVGAAEVEAARLGVPTSIPIFYADDQATSVAAVQPYYTGVHSASHHPSGVYGSLPVVEAMYGVGIQYMWQTAMGSSGLVSTMAHLYQRVSPTRPPIAGIDEDVVLHPFPLWGPNGPLPPVPPAPHPNVLATDGKLGAQTIRRWQEVMHTLVDGLISVPRSSLVVAVQQRLNALGARLTVDGTGIFQDNKKYLTVMALQQHLGTPADGILSLPASLAIRALQARLNAGSF